MGVPWIVRGDIDGFFGLFIDNLLQLMLMLVLSTQVCGLPTELVVGRILPGAAVSILVGNLFYAWQARKTGRPDATALPYGINTPSLLAYVFLIMAPAYHETKDPVLAWRLGLFACLLSGALETLGAFAGDWIRRHTPRAALLSALAGIALTFISMGFVFQIFASPWIALLPAILILISYASHTRLPFGLPGGLVAVALGTAIAWTLEGCGVRVFQSVPEAGTLGVHLPVPVVGDALALLGSRQGWRYLPVIFPMGLFTLLGSLQNLESAEAAGDRYPTRPSLLANGLGTLAAAFFGSAFPTTLYIGHPAWKAMGARSGYSTLNGIAITLLCLFGAIPLVLRIIPLEATMGILLWIGIIITAQAFQEVPREHALAVALGLIPSLAAWALFLVETSLRTAGTTLYQAAPKFAPGELAIRGMIALSQGFLLSSMILSAILVYVIEKRFLRAAAWSVAAGVFSMIGLIHGYELTPAAVEPRLGLRAAPEFAVMYTLGGILLAGLHWARQRDREKPNPSDPPGPGIRPGDLRS
jgi:AGZA family xanthine/uracil permease-like MFS transporter